MTSLTRWLLRTFVDQWPGGFPSEFVLFDRDDSYHLAYDTSTSPTTLSEQRRTQSYDLTSANVLGVATTAFDQTAAGLGGREYRAEPTLSVRLTGAHTDQHGHTPDSETFVQWGRAAVETVQQIDNGTLQDAPIEDAYVADPNEDVRADMADHKDSYRWQFEVGVRGYKQL